MRWTSARGARPHPMGSLSNDRLDQVRLWAARWRRMIRAWSGPLAELPLSGDALVLTPAEHAELLASGSAIAAALQRPQAPGGRPGLDQSPEVPLGGGVAAGLKCGGAAQGLLPRSPWEIPTPQQQNLHACAILQSITLS